MDDASLFPSPDTSQPREAELVQIVQQLAPLLGEPEGRPQPLEGGITNRNFRASFGGVEHVIRVPGKDTGLLEIDRGAERIANERAARIGIAPPVAAMLDEPQCIVTLFVEGAGMEPAQLREPATLTEVAHTLRAIHELAEPLPTSFDSFRVVETYADTARARGADVPDAYSEAHRHAREIEAALSGPEHDPVPCHNDLLAANFIRGAEQLWIVDWEYAGMGDRYFDLANFAVNNELGEGEQQALLEEYFGTPGADPHEPARRLAALRLMCLMSDFREAMWGVVQSALSELDFDFLAYAHKHFERLLATAAGPDFATWLQEAREPQG
ncbi:MAG: phosphotransferase [Actinomycetota bacterium]